MNEVNKKGIWIAAAALITLFAIWGGLIFGSRIGKIAVRVETFPADTKVSIGDHKTKRGTIYLKPGTYTIQASYPGFKSYSETIEVSSSANAVAVMLDPESAQARKILDSRRSDYDRARKLSYEAKQTTGRLFEEKNPIVKKLPDKNFIYSIGYIKDQSDPSGNSILLTVYASEGYRQIALNRIRQLGFDPTDFNIIFQDYENPFPL